MTEGLADKRSTKEQQRLKTTMAIEDEASNPKRIEIISTTDFHVTPPYVYWKTVRLRYIDEVDKEGTPPEKVDAVMVWRRKSTIFFNENACAHDSSAAAVAAGNAGSADAFDLGLERCVSYQLPLFTINIYLVELTNVLKCFRLAYHSTITTSQAFSYGSFLLGCLTALGLLYVYPYIVNLQ